MEIPFGYCLCGCGNKTKLSDRTVLKSGYINGVPRKYLAGHHRASVPVGSISPPNRSGKCQCGCGGVTPIATKTIIANGIVAGEHVRFIVGHSNAMRFKLHNPNPSGLCGCGCGQKTPIAKQSNSKTGTVKGCSRLFIHNHHGKLSSAPYRSEDRGYKTPCWIWQRATDKDGYGLSEVNGKRTRMHRYTYEQKHGKIPAGLEPDHLCKIKSCCNPDHLEPVTSAVNKQRGDGVKLSIELVRTMRNEFGSTGESYSQIAKRYGVTAMCAFHAINRNTWKNA